MITFILSLYSAILTTFLFGRWLRLVIARRRVNQSIIEENLSLGKEVFLREHPPLTPLGEALKDMKDEGVLEGDVISAFEIELERIERDEVEESVEEREYREEEMTKLKRGARR